MFPQNDCLQSFVVPSERSGADEALFSADLPANTDPANVIQLTMQTAPVQTPITGQEDISDLTQPASALAQFYRAFNSRDLGLMEKNWDQSSEAAMSNPLGGIKRGWVEIRSVYERIFSSDSRVQVEFWDYTLHVIGDVFYAVGRERGRLEAKGRTLDLAIRTTRLFRRDSQGTWRQIHHHGSFEDPKLLADYQAAVR